MKCECGATVEQTAMAAAVAKEIDEGHVVESIECNACPQCSDLDGDGYLFLVTTDEDTFRNPDLGEEYSGT